MKCPSCGADISAQAAACEYCGTHLREVEATGPREAASSGQASVFARIKASSAYARRLEGQRQAMLAGPSGIARAIPLVFLVIFVLASSVIALGMLSMGAGVARFGGGGFSVIPFFMAVVPIGFVVLGVMMFVATAKKMRAFDLSPVEAQGAVIVSKRTQVSGGSGDRAATTEYFLTAEFEDGGARSIRRLMGNSMRAWRRGMRGCCTRAPDMR